MSFRLRTSPSSHFDGLCVHQCYVGLCGGSTVSPPREARLLPPQRLAS